MSVTPIITFKAGKCELDTSTTPPKIKPEPTPGYIYLFSQDELMHFCWRPRSAPADEPTIDLLMIPGDGSFVPYTGSTSSASSEDLSSPTNGRIFVLKFSSSSQRHLFWLQSKSQYPGGARPEWFSPRDQKLGQIVDMLLTGDEIDVEAELRDVDRGNGDDGDDTMEDIEGTGPGNEHHRGGSGGAGPGATGGDVREEGEEAREGGADGGRAAAPSSASAPADPNDPSAIVQNLLRSLQGQSIPTGSGAGSQRGTSRQTQQSSQGKLYTSLNELLPPPTTLPLVDSASESTIDTLLSHLPPAILLLAQESSPDEDDTDQITDPDIAQAAIAALSIGQKKDILRRVLRSPQLHQALGSLTAALRDGGLPMVADALKVPVQNGGYIRGGGVPLGSGEAVEAFVEGVKKSVKEEDKKGGDKMDTD